MQFQFSVGKISGIHDLDEQVCMVKAFCKLLEDMRVEANLTHAESDKYLQGMLVALIVRLHERLSYLEQFAPVTTKPTAEAYQ